LFELAGFFYAIPSFRGTLKECIVFNKTFKSYILGWLGLPEHPTENIAEGKVIRPLHTAYLAHESRIILKDKTEVISTCLQEKEKDNRFL